MTEQRYTSEPAWRHPRRFLSEAGRDLALAFRIAGRLHRANRLAQHRWSLLGQIWVLVPVLALTAACFHLKSIHVISVGDMKVPYIVFVLAGALFWQVFVDALAAPHLHLSAARQLVARTRLPHEALILAGALDVLTNLALRALLLAGALLYHGTQVGISALMLPFGIAALLMLGLSLGLLIAPLGLLYSDIGKGISVMATFLFFLTPSAYSVSAQPGAVWNPLRPLLETTLAWLFDIPHGDGFTPAAALAVLLLIATWLLYRLGRPHLVTRLG